MSIHLNRAQDLLNGKVYIHSSVEEKNLDSEIWNVDLSNKTYQLYAHSLTMVNYLTNAFLETDNTEYLLYANKFYNTWLETKHKSKFVWHEHPVATRLKNIILLLKHRQQFQSVSSKDLEIIREHIEYLLIDDNYRENNHGIMMDRALGEILKDLPQVLNDLKEIIIKTVKDRSQNAILRDFSSKGLHLENSPDYHRLTTKWLLNIEENLNMEGESLDKKYLERLNKALKLDAIIVKPNKRYPIVGDSSDGQFKKEKSFNNFVDREAGRVILHNRGKRSQLAFISGYGSKGHKHYDDLSFTFHDGKKDIFNDSGKYNYKTKDPIRKHVVSTLGHNSLSVYKENYSLSNDKKIMKQIGIESFNDKSEYYVVKGFNKSYEGLLLERTIIFFKTNTIIILDQFTSKNQNTIAVNFNLGLGVKAEEIGKGKYRIKSDKTYILESHINRFTSVLLNDSNSTPCKISNKFNQYESNQRILYRQKTKKGEFLTSIINEKDELRNLSFDGKILNLELNKKKYNINLDKGIV